MKWITYPFRDFYNSFKTTEGGFSSRKLSAFAAIMAALYVTVKHTDTTNVVAVIEVLFLFALLCLGLVTFGDLVNWRTGRTKEVVTVNEKEKERKTVTETTAPADPKAGAV